MGFAYTSDWQVFDQAGRRKYLTSEERERCLAAADKQSSHVRALVYFLLFSGCRVSEALSLTTNQIDIAERAVWLRTLKRRRLVFRRVPLPDQVLALIADLRAGPGERIWKVHRSTAWRWVSDVTTIAGVSGPMACCRGMRHSYAMHATAKGVSPFALRKFLGHSTINTTMIYVDAVGLEERAFAERMW